MNLEKGVYVGSLKATPVLLGGQLSTRCRGATVLRLSMEQFYITSGHNGSGIKTV